MALDLKPELRVQLRDETTVVFTDNELDDILDHALAQVNMARPRVVRDVIALVDDDDQYSLVNVESITRVDLIDSDSKLVRTLPSSVWEVWGDSETATQTLYINPSLANPDYSLRVHGYGTYDYTTNDPPVKVRATILAIARAEAYRRLAADRATFRQWAESNPRGDTSVTELLGIINEADAEANRLLRSIKLIRKPVQGRF